MLVSTFESIGSKQVQLRFAPSNHSAGYIRDKSYSYGGSSPPTTFPLPPPSPSMYPSQRKDRMCYLGKMRTLFMELCWYNLTQYCVLSHKLIFDDLFKIYCYCPHFALSAFLTFPPFLLKLYLSFKAGSVAPHLLHVPLSVSQPPHGEEFPLQFP